MQFKTLNDNLVAYRYRKGAGPVVVFANALGSDQSIWDNVIETMGRHRATLTYDLRGQGASGITTDPYTMDQLGDDLIAVLDHLGLTQLVAAAVKFVPLGQTVGQKVLADLGPDLVQLADVYAAAPLSALGSSTIGAELAQMRHETMEVRIFRS